MPMNWIILILITLIVNILTFAICGFGGGFILLVAINGFSEADATSIFVIFTLMVFGISFFLSTAACWVFLKARRVEKTVRFWQTAIINVGVDITIILAVLSFFEIFRL